MRISIIIPIYNVAPYVEQCLQSVANQTYQGTMECILVDDCGTDESMSICDQFVKKYDGPIIFRFLHHDHNRGISAARNTGICNAQGEWIYFIDSDDWIYDNCIYSMLSIAEKYPQADIIQGSIHSEDKEQNDWYHSGYDIPLDKDYLDDPGQCRIHLQKIGCLAMMWNRLIKKSFILNNHLFHKEGITHEDNLWTFFAGKYIGGIAYCKTDTYYYRKNVNGITSSSSNEKEAKTYSVICDEIFKNIALNRWYNLELNYLLWRIQTIEQYGYENPFVFMHLADNRLLMELYKKEKNAEKNHTRYTKKFSYIRGLYKVLIYMNVVYERFILHK